MLHRIDVSRVPDDWPRMLGFIKNAIGPKRTPDRVFADLIAGESEAYWIKSDVCDGAAVLEPVGPVLWLAYIGGTVAGGPRARIAVYREVVGHIEAMAKQRGFTAIGLGGRNWRLVFPDWVQFDPDNPNNILKRLTHG